MTSSNSIGVETERGFRARPGPLWQGHPGEWAPSQQGATYSAGVSSCPHAPPECRSVARPRRRRTTTRHLASSGLRGEPCSGAATDHPSQLAVSFSGSGRAGSGGGARAGSAGQAGAAPGSAPGAAARAGPFTHASRALRRRRAGRRGVSRPARGCAASRARRRCEGKALLERHEQVQDHDLAPGPVAGPVLGGGGQHLADACDGVVHGRDLLGEDGPIDQGPPPPGRRGRRSPRRAGS